MYRTVLFFLICLLVSGGYVQAATVVFEDFSTDPLASRWTATNGSDYPWYWTGTNPSSIHGALPDEAGNPLGAMYTFSAGRKTMWTNDTTVRNASYSVSTDFIVSGNTQVADIVVGHYLQRQGDNSAYECSFALGGSGAQSWMGVWGWSGYGGEGVLAENWYQLVTDVTITDIDVSLVSRVVRLSDGVIMGTSPVYTDASAGRLTTASGYGYFVNLPGNRYWGQAVQTDNFVVTPEPATMALLGLGMLMFRRK